MAANSVPATPHSYVFGPFRLEPDPGLLYCREELVLLTPKALGILLVLVRNPGVVVSRSELIREVWADTFVEDSNITKNISILRKILDAEFPDTEPIRTLSKRGYQLAIPVAIAPRKGITSADPVKPAETEAPASPVAAAAPVRSTWSLPRFIAVVGISVLLIAVWNLRALVGRAPSPRIPVAVIGFHDLSGRAESAWLSQALSEMLITELEGDSKLRALPADLAARLRSDLSLPNQAGFSSDTLARIRKASSCDYVVTGGYLPFDGKVRLDIHLQDAAKQRDSMVFSAVEPEKNLPELAVKAGAAIRRHFGIPQLSASEEARRRSSMPADSEARVLYAEGLEKLRVLDLAGARSLLEQSVLKEPGFPLAHMRLSATLSLLGYDRLARAEARRALDLSAPLPRDERLEVEARNFEAASNWAKAGEIYRSLWTFFPDEAEFGFSLQRMQVLAGKPSEAERTLAALRTAPGTHDTARIALADAAAAFARGDFPKATTQYAAAIESARAQGARLTEGHAQAGQALALAKTGEMAKAEAAFQEAVRLCSETGDSACVSEALSNQASQLKGEKRNAEGIAAANRALQLARRDGNQWGIERALNIRATLEDETGESRSAEATLQECLAVSRRLSDIRIQAFTLHRMGTLAARSGDVSVASKLYAQEIELARQGDDKIALANALDSQGRLQQRQGDLISARNNLEAALSLRRETGDFGAIAVSLTPLANLARNQGDLDASRKLRTEECKILAEKQPGRLARCQLSIAELNLLDGRVPEAEATASSIASSPAGAKLNPGAEAFRILALARLALGNPEKAHEAIVKAQALAKDSADLIIYKAPIGIAAGRIEVALGHRRAGAALLKQALADATKADTLSLILDARLAIAEAELKDGSRDPATRIRDVKKDAEQRGYGLIAKQADKLLSLGLSAKR